jgi:hypothetical protein
VREQSTTALLVILLLGRIAGEHWGGSAKPAFSWSTYMIYLGSVFILTIGVTAAKPRVAMRMMLYMAVAALALTMLLLGWPYQVFVALLVPLAIVLVFLVLCLCVERLLDIWRVGSAIDWWESNSWPLCILALFAGIVDGVVKLDEAGFRYSVQLLSLSLLVAMVVLWSYRDKWLGTRDSIWSLIKQLW